jgi:hypothetical protein
MIGLDKIAHIAVSFMAHTVFTALLHAFVDLSIKGAALWALLPALALGLAKEYLDYLRYGGPSMKDMLANLAGLAGSLGTAWILAVHL